MSKTNDDFFEHKKEWSKTKDSILGCYLKPYFSKILHRGKPVCYIDCFSGKGIFNDGEDGSPLIALRNIFDEIEKSSVGGLIFSYFIELNHAKDLQINITNFKSNYNNSNVMIKVIDGKFEDNIDSIINKHRNATLFLYVDPYGIKALDINKFNAFARAKEQSVEMLINFNTWGFFREACRVLKVDFKLDPSVNKYLIEYDPQNNLSREELTKIAGGSYWINIVERYKNDEIKDFQAEQELAKGIANAFYNYDYVLNVPIKSNDNNNVPKYRLFHVTNHHSGCLLMADNMYKRISKARDEQRHGQTSLFDTNTEGTIVQDNEIEENLLKLISTYEYSNSDVLFANFFTHYGILTDIKKLREIAKQLEKDNYIEVKRTPIFSRNGKPTTFWTTKKGQSILIRRV